MYNMSICSVYTCRLSLLSFLFVLCVGQQRSRMLATLFKDERCQQLSAYGILEKMYLDRIIRGNQLQEFAAMLMPHQKATTGDGKPITKLCYRETLHLLEGGLAPDIFFFMLTECMLKLQVFIIFLWRQQCSL